MPVRLYNTLTRSKDQLVPISPDNVGLYTCGPTVYSTAHLGNLRTYLFEDILHRTLLFNGWPVKHVMNITDVGHLTGDGDMGQDKMEASAKAQHRSAYEIAAHHEQEFFADLARLNILKPTTILHATKTIDLQIALIKKLEANGFTYATSDGIYFDTAKDARYGRLSGQKSTDKRAGARVEVNEEKKHPTDFALWKFSTPADQRQMEWPSPWGTGFPGWHIECSAMSISEFPHGLDIHCGGIDHIAVHHENEIAQNEGAGYHNFVHVWMHGEFLKLPGKRMGKSEGNAITVQDIVDLGIPPLAYRYLVLQAHYRKILEFSEQSLRSAAEGLQRLYAMIDQATSDATGQGQPLDSFLESFTAALNDDLNTSAALAVLHDVMRSTSSWADKRATFERMDQVLGLDLLAERAAETVTATPEQVALLAQRAQARTAKDWATADAIRAEIESQGFVIVDGPDGPRLRPKKG